MTNIEEDDVVVEEIPVFLSKKLLDCLYVFQYPTKTHANFDTESVVNCFVEPVKKAVKVEFALDTGSKFFGHFKAEKFAHAKEPGKGDQLKKLMDTQTFISTHTLDGFGKYMIGIFANNELHLTPLTNILKLRPSFSYFDEEDKRIKAEQNALNKKDLDLQPVIVKFASSSKTKAKDKTMKRSSGETWCVTKWHQRSSAYAELEHQKLFATNQQLTTPFRLEAEEYINKLLPVKLGDIHHRAHPYFCGISRLKQMPLKNQLKVIITNVKMIGFEDILSILRKDLHSYVTSEKILQILPKIGVLIHGNWVPKSDIIYPAEKLSDKNGVSSEHMTRARDYVIFRFSRNKLLSRREVMLGTQLPPEESIEVLQSVARVNAEKKWELLLPPNKDFELKYPDLVEYYASGWRIAGQTFSELDFKKDEQRLRKRSIRDLILQKPNSIFQNSILKKKIVK